MYTMTTHPIHLRALKVAAWCVLACSSTFAAGQTTGVDEARRLSAAASAEAKANASRQFAEAFTLLQKNAYQAASEAYKSGLAADPAHVAARYYYGRSLDGLGDAVGARAQYEFAARLAPESPEGAIAKGILLEIDEDRASQVDGCW
jgi:tetratricopeptide (TPR) repeat protein